MSPPGRPLSRRWSYGWRSLRGLALCCTLMMASRAEAAAINFEDLITNGPGSPALPVTNQYDTLGVLFSNAGALDYANAIPGFAHSGSRAVELCYAAEFCSSRLTMNFLTSQAQVRVWVGVRGGLNAPRTVILRTFNGLGIEVGHASSDLPASISDIPISTPLEVQLGSASIDSATVGFLDAEGTGTGENAFLAVDDVEFNTGPACADITLAPDTLAVGAVNVAYRQQLTASGGTGPYSFINLFIPLPAWLTLSPAGLLSGTPTTTGDFFFFDVEAVDANGCFGIQPYVLIIGCGAAASITIDPPTLPDGGVSVAYSQQLTASGGTGPYTFRRDTLGGALPAGLTLSSSGQLSGTPTSSGVSAFIVRATDANGCFGLQGYVLTIGCTAGTCATIQATPTSVPCIPVNPCLRVPVTIGNVPNTPSGVRAVSVQLHLTGTLRFCAGNPTTDITQGDYLSGFPNTGLLIAQNPDGSVTVDQAIGGLGPCQTAASGTLFSLSLATTLAGGSGTVVVDSVTVRDCDNALVGALPGDPAAVSFAGSVPLTLLPSTLPAGTVNVAYSQQLSVSGGTGPYSFRRDTLGGALPAGLTLSSSGLLSGTPTSSGVSTFSVIANDANGCQGTRPYALSIGCGAAITLGPPSLPAGTVNVAYSQQLTASGGTGPYSFRDTLGVLPPGLTLSSSGLLSGTPTANGTYFFYVEATDSDSCLGVQIFRLIIGCPAILTISPPTLPVGAVNVAYSQQLSATGGTGPYSFRDTLGVLPAGLTLSSSGLLSGTPTATGVSSFSVIATDANGCSSIQGYALTIGCTAGNCAGIVTSFSSVSCNANKFCVQFAVMIVNVSNTPQGVRSVSVHLHLGGVLKFCTGNPTTDITQGGYLQPGGSQNSGLLISTLPDSSVIVDQSILTGPGTCQTAASGTLFNLNLGTTVAGGVGFLVMDSVTVRDCNNASIGVLPGESFAITFPDPITLGPPTLPAGTVNVAYSQQLAASGGTGPYAYRDTLGALPAGLTLSNSGLLSGTPTAPGLADFSVRASDANGCVGLQPYKLVVEAPCFAPTISQVSPLQGTVGTRVTITGTHLARDSNAVAVDFNGTPAPVLSATENEILTVVPAGAVSGKLRVTTCATAISEESFSVVTSVATTLGTPHYVGFGIPFVDGGTIPAAGLGLGTPDTLQWRLGHYLPTGQYEIAGEDLTQLSLGVGYWLITRAPAMIEITDIVPAPDSFVVMLPAFPIGVWNQLANPYEDSVRVSSLRVRSGTGPFAPLGAGNGPLDNLADAYRNDEYVNVTGGSISAHEAFWVFQHPGVDAELEIPRPTSAPFLMPANVAVASPAPLWSIRISAREGETRCLPVTVGALPSGARSVVEGLPPDPPGRRLRLTIGRPDGRGQRAISQLDPAKGEMAWDLLLTSKDVPSEIALTIESADLPGATRLHLLDPNMARSWELTPGVPLTLAALAGERRLRLTVSQGGAGGTEQAALERGTVYPNPSAGQTGLWLTNREPNDLSVAIFDLAGRRVWSHQEPMAPAGEHVLVWNGMDAKGSRIPAGVYLVRYQIGEHQGTLRLVRL